MQFLLVCVIIYFAFKYRRAIKRLNPAREDSYVQVRKDAKPQNRYGLLQNAIMQVLEQKPYLKDIIGSNLETVKSETTAEYIDIAKLNTLLATGRSTKLDPTADALLRDFYTDLKNRLDNNLSYTKYDFFNTLKYTIE